MINNTELEYILCSHLIAQRKQKTLNQTETRKAIALGKKAYQQSDRTKLVTKIEKVDGRFLKER